MRVSQTTHLTRRGIDEKNRSTLAEGVSTAPWLPSLQSIMQMKGRAPMRLVGTQIYPRGMQRSRMAWIMTSLE